MFKNMSTRRSKMFLTKLKSGRSKKIEPGNNNLEDKANVNEEYKEAFRTKSYVEMWGQVGQLEKTTGFELDRLSSISSSSSSSSSSLSNNSDPNYQINLSEYLLKPRQETLDKIESLNFHHLLLEFFEAGLDAANLCESLLQSIHRTRVYYQKIKRVIELSKKIKDFSDEQQCSVIVKELAGFAMLKNPLSMIRPLKFREIHETNVELFRKLTSKREKIKRKAKCKRMSKKFGSACLVIAHTTLVVALLVLAFHSVFGIIAAPGIATCLIAMKKKKQRKNRTSSSSSEVNSTISLLERFGAQLDISAKGIYILINDFDTISRLVWRLHDEIEHRIAIASMCIRNNGKMEVVKEVVRELCMHDSGFTEQLKELEEHTKLCFHTINKSRGQVIQEIIGAQ